MDVVLRLSHGNTFSSVQSLSCVQLFVTLWAAAHQASLSITSSQSLLKLMSIKSLMPFMHPILCFPLPFLPSTFHSIRGIFSNESVLHIRWPHELQHQSFQRIFRTDFLLDWLVWSPCSPRDSQESFLTPQFKSFSSLALSFPYGPALISIHEY